VSGTNHSASIVQTSPVLRYRVNHRVNQKKIMELFYIF